jgi:hypothetical protein
MDYKSKLIVKKHKIGNFISGVGNDNNSFTNNWVITNTNNLDIVFIENGSKALIICKSNNYSNTLELKAKFNYSTKINLKIKMSNEKSSFKVLIINENKRTIIKDTFIESNILENDEIKIIFNTDDNIEIGDIIGIIENIEIYINDFEICEIDYDD